MSDYETEAEVGTISELNSGGLALEAVERGQVDLQIATARKYPRSITAFKRAALELATLDEVTAGTMFYRLPRGGKKIEGPSVRMAEVVAYAWGHLRVDARIASEDAKTVTAVGTAFDLERNVAVRSEVTRRITDSQGRRYNDDMIAVTKNAACSIARREAVFSCVPRALYLDIVEQAKETSLGKAKSMAERRHLAFDWFDKAGVEQARILAHLGRRGMEDVTVDDLVTLTGYKNAIKDGELQLDEAFPVNGEPSDKAAAAESRTREVAQARRAQNGSAPAAGAAPATTPPAADPAQPGAHPELDQAGLTGQAAPAAEGDEQVPLSDDQSAFIALVLDTSKGTGRLPLADKTQRDRLREVANVLTAGGEVKAGDQLLSLAGDAKLGKAQAFGLLSKAIAADLLEETASDNQAPVEAPAAAEPGSLL
jgi:hypothetical protein